MNTYFKLSDAEYASQQKEPGFEPITEVGISVCICTMDRPEVLRRCLTSIYQGQLLPQEIIVSDDSLDSEMVQALCREFTLVHYVRGPRRGLCANRNVAVRACRGDFIALADDDAVLSPEFISQLFRLACQADPRTIFTGDVLEGGDCLTPPSNPSFWGHFGSKPRNRLETIHLNCNLFPRSAFDIATFDEEIVYGYEDMDLCSCLLAHGYQIEYHPEMVNQHLPPAKNQFISSERARHSQQARYYTSLKRYLLWQRKPLTALAYAALAPMHQTVHHLRRGELRLALVGFSEMSAAVRMTLRATAKDQVSPRVRRI